MNLNNLSMNYKIVFGISTVTILTLIFKYIKNLLNPDKSLSEGQVGGINQIISNRYTGDTNSSDQNGLHSLSQITNKLINDRREDKKYTQDMIKILNGLYDKLGEFNHIYQERMFENLIPSQIKKTIIHLSSRTLGNKKQQHKFMIASTDNPGLRKFKNVINFKLLAAQIPYVPHNIYLGDGNSHRLGYTGAEGDKDVDIPLGYYTIHTLINAINGKFDGIAKFGFLQTTQFITITTKISAITINPIKYPLFKRLGFQEKFTLDHLNNLKVADGFPDLSIRYIDILYKGNSPSADTLTNTDPILKRIPLDGQPGEIIYYDTPVSDYHSQELYPPDASSNLNELTFNFKTPDGSEYDFQGLHYDLKIEITELVEPTLLHELTEHRERDKQIFLDNGGSNELGTMNYTASDMDTNAWQKVSDAR